MKNAWYVAGWADEITTAPLGRKLLGEEVALYRDDEGAPIAMSDRCPHRFAELHLGKVKGDRIVCPYHGLEFDQSGSCVHNPNGKGVIPGAVKLKTYPVVERYNALWIWMGDPDKADADLIPDFSLFVDKGKYAAIFGYLEIKADYRLIMDNLLDLTHVEFLHPTLGTSGSASRGIVTSREEAEMIDAQWKFEDEPVTALFRMLRQKANKDPIDKFNFTWDMRWTAPANLFSDIWSCEPGETREQAVSAPGAHLLTPIDETTTHYFWAFARDCALDDPEFDKQSHDIVSQAFLNEDRPMIESQQRYLEPGQDIMSRKPLLLATDENTVRARRLLEKLIAEDMNSLDDKEDGNDA